MEGIFTRPATVGRWHDLQDVLNGGGDGKSCQCMWPVMQGARWRECSVEERKSALHDEIASGPAPGIIAYVGDIPAGWVRVGPRPHQRRLQRSRIVKAGSKEPFEETSVWAITCFSIRREYRRKGLTAILIRAAVEYAKDGHARSIEAYPIDNREAKVSNASLFVGTATTFLDQGFTIVSHPTPTRIVVSMACE
ncbi:GNAT family N-acetyltransferase [Bifidobacterium sp.]|uniref:GNAT family N-acetyltransferase n=1 Tax=Bifidobacterium sp. TaxID=41200 RepID=UPI0025B812DC|nr:GNAT family N-acetyltransferase [Bifidobacterium sp.]MCI1634639.1 GNAT family N-acetyltransferase [Bifidobacterium sp.]